ncbi:Alpha/Beta hydrolase protein [Hypoxylon trugodes]|uniref:Alpha/Beta hydrolase protein n=1 Tax=Hypoxylon trugodes TaxID=326681 RepID=UPI002193FA23|nr:Alpha/Beta hydrolase protein [Hypoxylon trugodes]KAI1387434.1 Alpha/Beta hydrolase protein [Hypoxylon trugodes]
MSTNNEKSQSAGGGGLELLKLILPKVPLMIKIILLHILKKSETSQYLDLKSELTVSVVRSIIDTPKPGAIAETQAMTRRDPGIKGRLWISKVASQVPPEKGILDALLDVVDGFRGPAARGTAPTFQIPDIVPVEAEWTGFREAATKESTLPDISEEGKYHELMKECKNPSTILFFHGGAYYLCDPVLYRPMAKRIAKMSGGRVYSVRYRLAPQDPFPAAILDALVSYFTLLYPPPGSIHEAVAPEHIVFSGDSAGGGISLALLAVLLELQRKGRKITWYGEDRVVPLPAGVANLSPWIDPIQSTPSLLRNGKWDYLPPPKLMAEDWQPPSDELWPAKPARKHIYMDDANLLHPLVCLQLNESWKGAPPVYSSCGWERNQDENRFIVSKLARDGVTVVFEEYQAMPHVFAAILPNRPETRRNYEGIANFVKTVCESPENIQSSYKLIRAKTLEEVDIELDKLSEFSEEEFKELARKKVASLNISPAPAPGVPPKL